MTVFDYYEEAYEEFDSLKLLIEFLVYEKKVITMDDEAEKLFHFMQQKFHNKMNEYLLEYKNRKEGV